MADQPIAEREVLGLSPERLESYVRPTWFNGRPIFRGQMVQPKAYPCRQLTKIVITSHRLG